MFSTALSQHHCITAKTPRCWLSRVESGAEAGQAGDGHLDLGVLALLLPITSWRGTAVLQRAAQENEPPPELPRMKYMI